MKSVVALKRLHLHKTLKTKPLHWTKIEPGPNHQACHPSASWDPECHIDRLDSSLRWNDKKHSHVKISLTSLC